MQNDAFWDSPETSPRLRTYGSLTDGKSLQTAKCKQRNAHHLTKRKQQTSCQAWTTSKALRACSLPQQSLMAMRGIFNLQGRQVQSEILCQGSCSIGDLKSCTGNNCQLKPSKKSVMVRHWSSPCGNSENKEKWPSKAIGEKKGSIKSHRGRQVSPSPSSIEKHLHTSVIL